MAIFWSIDGLGEDLDNVQGTLRIDYSHHTVEAVTDDTRVSK